MKKSVKSLILILLSILIISVPVHATESGDDPVLFTFNGKDIYQSEVIERAAAYAQMGAISSETAYEEAIEYMIGDQLVAEAKAAELGLDQYTEEEMAVLKEEAALGFEQQLDAYVEYFASQLSEEDQNDFREELRAAWAEIGTTVEDAEETHIFNQTKARLLETMEVEISEDEIQEVYEEQVEKDREYFSNNIRAYEYFTYYQNTDVWYVPEGFRGVLPILLTVDEELTDAYEAAVDAGEGVEEAREAILASKQDVVDEIYARIEDGEDFATLVEEYSEDPSLNEDVEQNGYAVHPESTVWGTEFAEGAFSDAMQEIGDVSDPVVSKYGIQILYYLRDIPSGPVAMNDRIRESITTYLTNKKRAEMLSDWAADYEITYNQEAIDALVASAAELETEVDEVE